MAGGYLVAMGWKENQTFFSDLWSLWVGFPGPAQYPVLHSHSQLLYLLSVVQSEIMFKEDNNFLAMIRNKSLISEAQDHCGRGHIDNLT